jgi:16S rRNA (cytidine1402-2'-O)-methyltransferase
MLYIVSTPIGNLEDMTFRAVRILNEVNVILCEDTREAAKLLKHFKVPHKPLISLFEENEVSKISDIVTMLKADQSIALISDSGTPLVSDPGYKLVREALENGVVVQSIPGPSAPITALVSSGLPPDKFIFLGFLPEKDGHRHGFLEKIKINLDSLPVTVIFYVSPHEFARDLETLKAVFGNIEIVTLREMTKVYEERFKGTIDDTLKKFFNPKGEFVVLFHLR